METNKEFHIDEFMHMLLKWKKHIVAIVGLALVIGLILAFSVTRYYKSVAVILPPKETGMVGLSSISNVMKSLPSGLGKLAGNNDSRYDYIAILRSRTVIETVINKFGLLGIYSITDNSMEKAVKEFKANSEVEWADGDVFEIRVWDKDPGRAADMVNYLVEILNERSYELQSQEAHNNRIFIEKRVIQNRIDLKKAEDELQRYQEETGTIVVLQPTTQGFSSIAELYGMKALKEIEMDVLGKTIGKDNQEFKQKQIELQAIDDKIKNIPEIGVLSLRLYRELAIQQKIMEFIIPLYEEAKINENKSIPVAYVLDKAVPGERPDRPKRLYIVGIAFLVGVIFSITYIVVREIIPTYAHVHEYMKK